MTLERDEGVAHAPVGAKRTIGVVAARMRRTVASRWFYGVVALCALFAMPAILPPFRLFLATLILVYAIVALGLNVVMGYSGQISVAHAGFMGLGAYATALLMTRAHLPLPAALVIAVALTTGLGFVVGIPALRISGHYLALATLAFQLIVENVISNWQSMTNGTRGLAFPAVAIGPYPIAGRNLYFVVLVIAGLSWLVVRNLAKSRVGRAWRALRDQELAAAVFGVSLPRYKTLAFAISAGYASLAGGLFGLTVSFLDPGTFDIWESVKDLTMVVFGGLGTLFGPIFGSTLITAAPEVLTGFKEHSLLVFYALLLLMLMFLPGGLADGARRLARRVRLVGARRSETPADTAHAQLGATLPAAGVRVSGRISSTAEGDDLLKVTNVTLRFGGLKALDGVDLTIHRGEVKGVIGPNGAGKTSLFNVITRVYPLTSGAVVFDGQDIARRRTHEVIGLGIARTFQNVEMFRSMTVVENVMVGAHHRQRAGVWQSALSTRSARREDREARERAMALLRWLSLDKYAEGFAEALPLGVQRRVEIARAMAAEPQLLLLDEPASGLTAAEVDRLRDDIASLRDLGVTVLLIEHNVRFVMRTATSITTLDRGRVIFDGTAAETQANPEVIRAYLGDDVDGEGVLRELSL